MPTCHHAVMPPCNRADMPTCGHAVTQSCHHAIVHGRRSEGPASDAWRNGCGSGYDPGAVTIRNRFVCVRGFNPGSDSIRVRAWFGCAYDTESGCVRVRLRSGPVALRAAWVRAGRVGSGRRSTGFRWPWHWPATGRVRFARQQLATGRVGGLT
jgi:hypothetical protein